MSSFVQAFGFGGEGEPREEHEYPAWIGPPEDETGRSSSTAVEAAGAAGATG
jgi:hypothetical protein